MRELKADGYLKPQQVKEIRHPQVGLLEETLSRKVQKITLQLTQNCNFRCKYCHYTENTGAQRVHANRRMSFETVKKAILFLREHSLDLDEVYIGFYGGEPLLEFELMRQAIEYAEKALEGKKINYMLTTNSVLLNEKMIAYIEEHEINLLVSLDGPKEINDLNRVTADGRGTFDRVIEKLKYIYEAHPKLYRKMSVNMVMNPSHDFDKILNLFKDYPFLKKINIMSTIVDDVGAKEKNQYEEVFTAKKTYYDFLCYLSVIERFPEKRLPAIITQQRGGILEELAKFKPREEVPKACAPGGSCTPGKLRLMATVDGNLVACERVNEISDCMILGDLEHGISIEKAKALLNVAEVTKEACLKCWAFWGCTLCAKYADDHGKLSPDMRKSYCGESKQKYLYRLKERVMFQEAAEIYHQVPII